MVLEHRGEHTSQWAAMVSIAAEISCTAQTLIVWVKTSSVDSCRCGRRDVTLTHGVLLSGMSAVQHPPLSQTGLRHPNLPPPQQFSLITTAGRRETRDHESNYTTVGMTSCNSFHVGQRGRKSGEHHTNFTLGDNQRRRQNNHVAAGAHENAEIEAGRSAPGAAGARRPR